MVLWTALELSTVVSLEELKNVQDRLVEALASGGSEEIDAKSIVRSYGIDIKADNRSGIYAPMNQLLGLYFGTPGIAGSSGRILTHRTVCCIVELASAIAQGKEWLPTYNQSFPDLMLASLGFALPWAFAWVVRGVGLGLSTKVNDRRGSKDTANSDAQDRNARQVQKERTKTGFRQAEQDDRARSQRLQEVDRAADDEWTDTTPEGPRRRSSRLVGKTSVNLCTDAYYHEKHVFYDGEFSVELKIPPKESLLKKDDGEFDTEWQDTMEAGDRDMDARGLIDDADSDAPETMSKIDHSETEG
ncbi:Hypothetical protein D9617_24g016280 [Elsinoe fawcettii]|nr:Hypothetical protein D9617_24g016280 [Elsinoe fawcettii]